MCGPAWAGQCCALPYSMQPGLRLRVLLWVGTGTFLVWKAAVVWRLGASLVVYRVGGLASAAIV